MVTHNLNPAKFRKKVEKHIKNNRIAGFLLEFIPYFDTGQE
jgi:hypothetical protein